MTYAAAGRASPRSRAFDHRGDGEAAAGGFSREGDVRGGDPVVQEGFIGRKSVVNRSRIRVLGGEPVVDGDDLGVRPPTELRGQACGQEGVRDHVHAAVEVQNDLARFDSINRDLGGTDTTQCGFGDGHIRRQGLRRYRLSEQSPLLIDTAADR